MSESNAQLRAALEAAAADAVWRERERYVAMARFEGALENIRQGLAMFDRDRSLVLANQRFCDIFGLERRKLYPGMAVSRLARLALALGDDVDQTEIEAAVALMLGERDVQTSEIDVRGRMIKIAGSAVMDGSRIATFDDVTEQRRAEASVRFLAHHDALTGLANRAALTVALERAIEARTPAATFAVLSLDLDRFKNVNDTYGHSIGDRLLQEVALRITRSVRTGDIVARLGGDEFVAIISDVEAERDVTDIAELLIAEIGKPYRIDDLTIACGTSIGATIAQATDDGSDVLKKADVAMYAAKRRGRGCWVLFEDAVTGELGRRLALEADISSAIARDELQALYRLSIDVPTGRVLRCAAAICWHHPHYGSIDEDHVYAAAARAGVTVEVGTWIVQRACAEAMTWPLRVAVVVRAPTAALGSTPFRDAVLDAVEASRGRLHLELEIGDDVFFEHAATAAATLRLLHEAGVALSLRESETSVLARIVAFPFDRVTLPSLPAGEAAWNAFRLRLERSEGLRVDAPLASGGVVEHLHRTQC